MKRFVLSVLAVTCAAGSSAALADGPRIERTQATWQLLSVEDLRILHLVYESGGCRQGNPSVDVVETRSRIRLAVKQDEVVEIDGEPPVCTLELRYGRVNVVLRRPVGGRRIVGGPRMRSGGLDPARVPGVADLDRRDAVRALRFQGFEVRTVGRRSGAVAFQSPMPGRRAPERLVRLTIGRNLFPVRRLKSCLRRAGQRVVAGQPDPGDLNAPDLELGIPSGFVALYADPARAKENAPAIRRNARRFDGAVERHGGTTIVWVEQPAPSVAEAIRRCVI